MELKEKIASLRILDYNYNLPDDKIAKYPLKQRGDSKLLFFNNSKINDGYFRDLPQVLPEKSLLIFNNTKVVRARMEFFKATGARIEIFCLEPVTPSDYQLIFNATQQCTWNCIVGNARKWKDDDLVKEIEIDGKNITIKASKANDFVDTNNIIISWNDSSFSFGDIQEAIGKIPIPPYLNRDSEESDNKTYQTVYSKIKGSVAAPTAGLHFTDEMIDRLKTDNHSTDEVTLHVGAGTFKPVKSDIIGDHPMHTEHFVVELSTIKNLLANIGSIISVGTTSVRTIETLYWLGVMAIENELTEYPLLRQWRAYELNQNYRTKESLEALVSFMEKRQMTKINGATQIIIAPGYKFRVIRGLITNFHQPQSTLLLLISALIGDKWKDIYSYALENNYRFLSYGDSSLILA